MSPLLVQNSDTGESDRFPDDKVLEYVHQLGSFIMTKYQLKKPPILFTIYKNDPENNRYLEEDDQLKEVINAKLDEKTPIWWQSSELNPELIYQMRIDRYKRTGYDMTSLSQKKIFIAGIGLLGSELALDCAVFGIQNLTLLDYGNVDWFNIYRQPIYSKDNVFKTKVEAAQERLEDLGGMTIKPLNIIIPSLLSLQENRAETKNLISQLDQEISKADVVITALDTFSARMVIQTIAIAKEKLLINTAAGLVGGTIQIVMGLKVDPCLACGIYHDREQDGGACTLASFGTPKIIAGFTMDTLIDLLSKKQVPFNYIKYDHISKDISKDHFEKATDCEFCGKNGIIPLYKRGDKSALIEWLYQ